MDTFLNINQKEFYSIFLHYYVDEKGYFFWLSVASNDTLIKINDNVNSLSFDYEIKNANKDEVGVKIMKIRKGLFKEFVDSKGRLFTAINI